MNDKCPECGDNEFWGNRVYFPVYQMHHGKLTYINHLERTTDRTIECQNCGWKIPRDINFNNITPNLTKRTE